MTEFDVEQAVKLTLAMIKDAGGTDVEKPKNSHGGARSGSGRKAKRSGRRRALPLYNQVRVLKKQNSQLQRTNNRHLESKSTLTVYEQRRRDGALFCKKVMQTLTFERFINALILSGAMQNLLSADTIFEGFAPFQEEFNADFINPDIKTLMAICTRGGSKTLSGALGAAYLLCKIKRFRESLLSGSKGQNEQFCLYMDLIFEPFPQMLKKNNMEHKVLWNYSRFYSLPSNQQGARSKRADMLILDEAVEIFPAVIRGALGQRSSSQFAMVRIMTTPHLDGNNDMIKEIFDHITMTAPDNMKVYNWSYLDCPWINEADVLEDKRIMSYEEFKAEYLGQWGAKTGGVYIHEEVDASLMDESEIFVVLQEAITNAVPLEWHDGIDWGDIHLTVDIEGFEYQGIVYVLDMEVWNVEENKRKDWIIGPNSEYEEEYRRIRGKEPTKLSMVDFALRRHHQHANHVVTVHSEAAPIATSDNHRLERKLRPHGIFLTRSAFGTVLDKDIDPKEIRGIKKVPKETFVQISVGRFNHHAVRINRKLLLLIKQIKNAVRNEKGEIQKGNDDAHDAFLHLMASFRAKKGVKYHKRRNR